MRQINNGRDSILPKKDFVDVIVMISGLYCQHRRTIVNLPLAMQVARAAEEAGWTLENGDEAVAKLVQHIATASGFRTPLIRPEKWDDALTVAALKRFN